MNPQKELLWSLWVCYKDASALNPASLQVHLNEAFEQQEICQTKSSVWRKPQHSPKSSDDGGHRNKWWWRWSCRWCRARQHYVIMVIHIIIITLVLIFITTSFIITVIMTSGNCMATTATVIPTKAAPIISFEISTTLSLRKNPKPYSGCSVEGPRVPAPIDSALSRPTMYMEVV